ALPRRLGGVGAARGRAGRPSQPRRGGAEETGHLPASVAEGPGHVPGHLRPPGVLAAGRGPQPPHRHALRSTGSAGVLRAGRVRAVAGPAAGMLSGMVGPASRRSWGVKTGETPVPPFGGPTIWRSHHLAVPPFGGPTIWRSHHLAVPPFGGPTI